MPPKSKEFLSSDESEAESTDSEVEVKKKKKKEIKNKVPNLLFLFQSTVNLIPLENMSDENKGLECTITYNNIESRFPNHVV